jgi:hypothetical protein
MLQNVVLALTGNQTCKEEPRSSSMIGKKALPKKAHGDGQCSQGKHERSQCAASERSDTKLETLRGDARRGRAGRVRRNKQVATKRECSLTPLLVHRSNVASGHHGQAGLASTERVGVEEHGDRRGS